MHTLPDFLSWSVLSCLSFSSTLQILAMAHVWSQVGVSCVRFPGLPTTEDYRGGRTVPHNYRVAPTGATGGLGDTGGLGEEGGWRQFCSAQTPVRHWSTSPTTAAESLSCVTLSLDSTALLLLHLYLSSHLLHIPTFLCPAPRSDRDCVCGASTTSPPLIFRSPYMHSWNPPSPVSLDLASSTLHPPCVICVPSSRTHGKYHTCGLRPHVCSAHSKVDHYQIQLHLRFEN